MLMDKSIILTKSAQQQPDDKFYLHMQKTGTRTKDCEIVELKKSIHTLSSELQLLTGGCKDKNVLKTLKERLKASISVVKVLMGTTNTTKSGVSLFPKTHHATNSNHDKQLTFHSTSKRKYHVTNTLSKPSSAQMSEQRKN